MREKRKGLPAGSGLPATMKVDGFLKNEKKIRKKNEGNEKMGGRKWEKGGDERTPQMGIGAVFGKGCREKKKKWKSKMGVGRVWEFQRAKKKRKKRKRVDGEPITKKKWEEKKAKRKKEK